MTPAELNSFRSQLLTLPVEAVASTLTLLEKCAAEGDLRVIEQAAEMAEALKNQATAHRILSVCKEVAITRSVPCDTEFLDKWRGLLDSKSQDTGRYEALDAALREFQIEGKQVLHQNWNVRGDNRQAILRINVFPDAAKVRHLHKVLLSLLPVLVNNDNPNEVQQAAILDVSSDAISDKESLTLMAHPSKSQFELLKAWRGREESVLRTTNLMDMLDYLQANYPCQ